MSPDARCALCCRSGIRTTRHHLVPRMRHRQKRIRRHFTRDERLQTVDLCSPCHRHVHATLSEKELGESYHSLGSLRSHPEIARFVDWIRNKPPHLRIRPSRSA